MAAASTPSSTPTASKIGVEYATPSLFCALFRLIRVMTLAIFLRPSMTFVR